MSVLSVRCRWKTLVDSSMRMVKTCGQHTASDSVKREGARLVASWHKPGRVVDTAEACAREREGEGTMDGACETDMSGG